jgi:uncharacterized protein (DUF302 family)
MKKLLILLSALFALIVTDASASAAQDIRIFSAPNADGKITPATVEKAFESVGFSIDGNNNMNKPFSKRFGTTHYKTYHLFTVHSADLVSKLASKYPQIGLLTPLSMSIWSDDSKKSMQISSLSLRGMSRITQIPKTDKNLIAIAKLLEKALKKALPEGTFQKLNYAKVADMKQQLATTFETEFEVDEDATMEDAKDDFEDEFEGELEPIGFLFPGFISLKDELDERGVTDFELYDTYSICKLDVIHPISKTHPEVGAFAPCTFYIYKKKSEDSVHMGFPSVDNWISATDIEDEVSLKPLVEAQKLLEDVVKDMTE